MIYLRAGTAVRMAGEAGREQQQAGLEGGKVDDPRQEWAQKRETKLKQKQEQDARLKQDKEREARLEAELAALEDWVDRGQQQLYTAVSKRDRNRDRWGHCSLLCVHTSQPDAA